MHDSSIGKKCALCSTPLTRSNQTKEHIIPHSIGGRKKTKGFICIACNSAGGENWEVVLANQFLWFSLATGVKREDGDHPNLLVNTTEGEKLLLRHDGTMVPAKPHYEEQDSENGNVKIQIKARTTDEAKKMIKGVARKYPSIDPNIATKDLLTQESYLDSPLEMSLQFGGPEAGRSMVKTALALASEYGVDHEECGKAVDYLKNAEAPPPFGFCYTVDLIVNRPLDDIFHCVAVSGLPKHGKLLGYIEYFNTARIIIELSGDYGGKEFHHSYAIDPTTGIELDIQVNFNVQIDILNSIINSDGMPLDKYTEVVSEVLPIILKKNFQREKDRAIAAAMKFAYERLGVKPDEDLSLEKYEELLAIIREQLTPFIQAQTKNHFFN
ncbi:HNH endonuclease [Chromobacterium violaceum]|uniref:HNH endonuclease n=1 Tax=Chromobacterium violaceum TaxID=536 RepID=UPI0035A67663